MSSPVPGQSLPALPLGAPVVAHRGGAWNAPENTLAAFRRAMQIGADGCEFDVRATKDRRIVVIHDKNLKRTTGANALVASKTLADIQRLDAGKWGKWKPGPFAGEKIPTLAEALAVLKESPSIRPVVEIKDDGIEQQVVEAIRDAGMAGRAVVIAFSAGVVKNVRRIEPRLAVAWLYGSRFRGSAGPLIDMLGRRAEELGVPIVDLGHNLLTREIVARLRARGLSVWAWTVDTPSRMERLIEWGVDSITTNRPDVLLQVRARMRQ